MIFKLSLIYINFEYMRQWSGFVFQQGPIWIASN